MRGHSSIIKLRVLGLRPSDVFVTVSDLEAPRRMFADPEMAMTNGSYPEVIIEPSDKPETADFRFLTDLRIHINGADAKQVKAYYDRIMTFNPRELIATAKNSRGILHYRATPNDT